VFFLEHFEGGSYMVIFKNGHIIIFNSNLMFRLNQKLIIQTWVFNIMTGSCQNVGHNIPLVHLTFLLQTAGAYEVVESLT
jgi:hypothetical protein